MHHVFLHNSFFLYPLFDECVCFNPSNETARDIIILIFTIQSDVFDIHLKSPSEIFINFFF